MWVEGDGNGAGGYILFSCCGFALLGVCLVWLQRYTTGMGKEALCHWGSSLVVLKDKKPESCPLRVWITSSLIDVTLLVRLSIIMDSPWPPFGVTMLRSADLVPNQICTLAAILLTHYSCCTP